MDYDVIIAGGGPAGVGAAYAAALGGARTLLTERSGRLGGMATQALVGPFMGRVDSPIVREVMDALGGLTVDPQQADLILFDLLSASGVEILLHTEAVDTVREGHRVRGVTLRCREGERNVSAHTVVDATGDGELAFRAGVPFETGRPRDRLTQPLTIMFHVAGIDPARRFCSGSEADARNRRIGGRPWADIVMEGRARGELPESVGVIRLHAARRPDANSVNATQMNGLDGTCSADLTRAEIEGRRQAFQVLDFLRRRLPGYENAYISCMPAVVGVRETRRFEGLARLEKSDCVSGRRFDDAVVRGALFGIDIHNPSGYGQAEGHGSHLAGEAERVLPYDIPYGALVPRRVDGLLFAGRCLSASHEALASCRVMCIAMATGAGAGAAAAYAARHGCAIRDVPAHELARTIFRLPRRRSAGFR